jgi:2-iminobutanoate/2-iminopropanoate deaminase
MAHQIVFAPNAATPPPTYSQAVKAAGLVFVSAPPQLIPSRAPSRAPPFKSKPDNV